MNNLTDKKSIIATRVKQARELSGLSQAQVAKLLKLHRPSISEIEAGRRNVTADELSKLAEIYSVDLKWLAGAEQTPHDGKEERVRFAARQLANLKTDDLDKVMNLLRALRPQKSYDE